MKISIVSPVYKAAEIIPILVERIQKSVVQVTDDYEIILVEDGGPDDSWNVVATIATANEKVKGIKLSRNFGQHPAIMAGLASASGDWIVVMDCDLQDQPEEIVKMYEKAMQGYDMVLAKRLKRQDGVFKRMSSRIFAKSFNYLAGTKVDYQVSNFGIYNKKVIDSVLTVGDYIKSFPLFIYFSGFNSTTVIVEHAARANGATSYSFSKLISLAFNSIISYSNKPLKIFVKFGMLISFLSFLGGTINLIMYFNGMITVSGYSSIIISIWFLSGIIITVIGVVGIYVGKVFEQTKNRPAYIIDKVIE